MTNPTPMMSDHEAETPAARQVEIESVLTCPACGSESLETMPTDACQFFFECPHCGVTLRPKDGDCCVFCSYGSVACPPVQVQETECCS